MQIGDTTSFLNSVFILEALRITVLIFLILYAIFSFIVMKQVTVMTGILITPVSPWLKALAIIHAGFSLGFIVLALGIL